MTTKVYGNQNDCIYFEGDFNHETNRFNVRAQQEGILLVLSDGTVLEVTNNQEDHIWNISVHHKGILLESIQYSQSRDDKVYSDIVSFKDGLKWAYAAAYVHKQLGEPAPFNNEPIITMGDLIRKTPSDKIRFAEPTKVPKVTVKRPKKTTSKPKKVVKKKK